mmetsp:Transcript_56544/g.120096  ORF Transcript_56544/g.120096 Transcript_56544/m.120096 type:complete len:247 (-) Transcript_56544:1079-1819(-)
MNGSHSFNITTEIFTSNSSLLTLDLSGRVPSAFTFNKSASVNHWITLFLDSAPATTIAFTNSLHLIWYNSNCLRNPSVIWLTSFLVRVAGFENEDATDPCSAGTPRRNTKPSTVSFSNPGPDRRRYGAEAWSRMLCIIRMRAICCWDAPAGTCGRGGWTLTAAWGVFAGGTRNEGILAREIVAFLFVQSSRSADARNSPFPPTPSLEPSSSKEATFDNESVICFTTSPTTVVKDSASWECNSSQTQ